MLILVRVDEKIQKVQLDKSTPMKDNEGAHQEVRYFLDMSQFQQKHCKLPLLFGLASWKHITVCVKH